MEWRGRPQVMRCDNGPEYISHRLQVWAKKEGIQFEHIQPGKPQQNAYVERYNRTVRYDWLGQYLFENIEEVQLHATRWLWTYNNERPHSALGGYPRGPSWPRWPRFYFSNPLEMGGTGPFSLLGAGLLRYALRASTSEKYPGASAPGSGVGVMVWASWPQLLTSTARWRRPSSSRVRVRSAYCL